MYLSKEILLYFCQLDEIKIGKIMKSVSYFFLYQENFINLDEDEKKIYEKIIDYILEDKKKKQNAVNKRWQKVKAQTEQTQKTQAQKEQIQKTQAQQTQSEHPKTQKIPNILPISQTNKKNIYQQPITQNIQQKNKVDNFNYLKKGVLRI